MSDLEINYAELARRGIELNKSTLNQALHQKVRGMDLQMRRDYLDYVATGLLNADNFDRTLMRNQDK